VDQIHCHHLSKSIDCWRMPTTRSKKQSFRSPLNILQRARMSHWNRSRLWMILCFPEYWKENKLLVLHLKVDWQHLLQSSTPNCRQGSIATYRLGYLPDQKLETRRVLLLQRAKKYYWNQSNHLLEFYCPDDWKEKGNSGFHRFQIVP